MPSINSFRIVNFDYDNGKKKIADEIYELEGNNTLIALENGGGKTVIIHLLLNIIMPKIDMGNRKLSDYFKGNTTTHLLMEWNLDGEGKDERLLTGMCIKASDKDIKYFNYTNIYTEKNPYDIKNIPLIDTSDNRVKTYTQWLKEIKELRSSSRIQYFPDYDNKSKYRNFLKNYKIYHSEFHAIKTINETEGGIDKFFAKAKKSKDIIESIIIPSISDINYERNNKNSLKESFKNHIQQLKAIPELEKSIEEYENFLEKGKIINQKLKKYKDYTESKLKLEEKILLYKLSLKNQIKEIESQISNLKIEIDEIEKKINDFKYKEKSLEAYEIKKEISNYKKTLNKLQEDYKNSLEELKKQDYKLRFLKSSIAFSEIESYEIKVANLEQRLRKLTEDKSNQEYFSCLLEYKKLLKDDIENLEDEKAKFEKNLLDKEKENKKILKNLENVESNIKEEEKFINVGLGIKKGINDNLAVIEKEIEENLLYFSEIDKNFEEENKKFANLEGEIKENFNKIENLESLIDNAKEKINKVEKDKYKQEENKKTKENKKDEYIQTSQLIKQDLRQIVGVEIKLFDDSMDILLTEKEKEKNLDIIHLEIEIRDLKSKNSLYEKSNYYLPYKEILDIKSELEDQNISCITGVQYLKRQPNPKILMDTYPLLIYSIIITKKDLTKIDNVYEDLKDIEKPMVFYTGDTLNLEETIKEHELENIKNENKNLYIMKTENIKLAINEEKFNEHKKSIIGQINQKEEKLSRYKESYDKIQKTIHKYEEFKNKYNKGYLENLSEEILFVEERIQSINREIKNENQSILRNKDTIKDIENKNEELKEAKENQKKKIENIKKYIEKRKELQVINEDINKHKKTKEEFETKKEKATKDSENLNNIIEEISRKLNKLKENLQEEKTNLEETIFKLNNYKILDLKQIEITYESKTKLIGKIQALELKLEDVDINDVEAHLHEYYQSIKRLKEEIREYGFNLEEENDFEKNIKKSDLEGVKIEISSIKNKQEKITLSINKEDKKITKLEGKLENVQEDIIRQYAKEEYIFEEKDSKDINYYNEKLKELAYKKNQKTNEKNNKNRESEKLNNYYTNRLLTFIKDNSIDLILSENISLEALNEEIIEKDIETYNNTINNLKEIYELIREKTYNLKSENTSSGVIKTLDKIMELLKPDIESCKNIEEIFNSNIKKIENAVMAKKEQLKEVDKSKKSIVISCVQRSKTLYEQLNDVDKYSKILINDKYQKLIKFIFPKVSDEEWEDRIDTHISLWINEMKENESMQDPIKIDKEIENFVRPESLLDSAINLDEFTIKISKPRSNENNLDYYQWEEVVNWSGGEKLSAFFAMFISIISYLRRKRSVEVKNKKVIIIDNPFGQANAEFLLNYIFKLSEKNDTQMICFTGITEESIFKQFPLIISLVHREITKDRSYLVENNRIENRNLESAKFEIKAHQESLF